MKISKSYRPELVASRDPERPNLADPYLDAAAERVVATNGFAMVALPVETERKERSRYLAVPLLKAARKLGDDEERAEIEDQEIKPFGVLWPTEQHRTFPDWKAIVPGFHHGDANTATVTLNARLLQAIAGAMGTGGPVRITVQLGRPDTDPSPILVQPITEDPEEVGVLMPIGSRTAGEALAPGQECPTCKRLLAAGAPCPDHGMPPPSARGDVEHAADALLQNAGSGDLTRADTKGEAVARKLRKGGRHGA